MADDKDLPGNKEMKSGLLKKIKDSVIGDLPDDGIGGPIDDDGVDLESGTIVIDDSTGPKEIDPSTGIPYGLNFPVITIRDMVKAQESLLEHLKIDKLLSVLSQITSCKHPAHNLLVRSVYFPKISGIYPYRT